MAGCLLYSEQHLDRCLLYGVLFVFGPGSTSFSSLDGCNWARCVFGDHLGFFHDSIFGLGSEYRPKWPYLGSGYLLFAFHNRPEPNRRPSEYRARDGVGFWCAGCDAGHILVRLRRKPARAGLGFSSCLQLVCDEQLISHRDHWHASSRAGHAHPRGWGTSGAGRTSAHSASVSRRHEVG